MRSNPLAVPLAIVLAALSLVSVAGCSSTRPAAADAAGARKDPARELEVARLELRIAEFDAQSKLANAEAEVGKGERAQALARREIESFTSLDVKTQLEAAAIDHDRKAYAAEEARAELAELEAMYAAEEFAKSTKELVLHRGRRKLEIAQRDLVNGQQKLELLRNHTLAKKQLELEGKLLEADASVEKARRELARVRLDSELGLAKARAKVADLEQKAKP